MTTYWPCNRARAASVAWPGGDMSLLATSRMRPRPLRRFPWMRMAFAGRYRGTWPRWRPMGASPFTGGDPVRSTRAGRRSFPRRSSRRSRPTPASTTPSWSECPMRSLVSGWRWLITLDELQDHCRQHIAGYKIPRQLLLVEDIAQTAAGKPDAQAAKALFETV